VTACPSARTVMRWLALSSTPAPRTPVWRALATRPQRRRGAAARDRAESGAREPRRRTQRPWRRRASRAGAAASPSPRRCAAP
jgi:hypothetical protein